MFMYNNQHDGKLPYEGNLPDGFRIICITHREICQSSLCAQVEKLCRLGVRDFILREKDLTFEAYATLAEQVLKICQSHGANLILHSFWQCSSRQVHFPLWLLEQDYSRIHAMDFDEIGCSCHSIDEAKRALELGATYITASHIYPTDCKKGLAPRGLEFLKEICDFVKSQKDDNFPIYALGGIRADGSQFQELQQAGAAGACLMSGLMNI